MFKILVLTSSTMLVFNQCKKEEPEPLTPTVVNDPDVSRQNVTIELAYNTSSQTDPVCFIDLDSARVFSVSQAASHASEIDLVYVLRYSNANDPMLISLGNFDGQAGYPISSWDKTTLGINAFNVFNHTSIDAAPSSLTTSNFAAITKLSQLKTYVGTGPGSAFDFEEINPTHIGNIYSFRTQQNKVGAIRIIDCQNGSSGYVTMEIVKEQ